MRNSGNAAIRIDDYEPARSVGNRLYARLHNDILSGLLRPGEALAIMQPGAFEKMKALGLPMQVLHDDPRRVLVRKP